MAEYDNQTSTFAGDNFSTSMDNQKRALLASMAERGAEGAQAFKTAQATNADQRQVALNAAAARGAAINAPDTLNAELRDTFDSMSNVGLGDSALSSEREMARIAASNSAYLDQMKTVAPLREQYYNAELAKIAAQQRGTASPTEDDNPYNVDLTGFNKEPGWSRVLEGIEYADHPVYKAGGDAFLNALAVDGYTRGQASGVARRIMETLVGPGEHRILNEMTTQLSNQFRGVTSTPAVRPNQEFDFGRGTMNR